MLNDVHVLSKAIDIECSIKAGQMGSYFTKYSLSQNFPQFEIGVYMGGKPDPDLKSTPMYGALLGLDQNDNVNEGKVYHFSL